MIIGNDKELTTQDLLNMNVCYCLTYNSLLNTKSKKKVNNKY